MLLGAPRAGCPVELFRVARSTNANVVVSELDEAAAARGGGPVRASWILLAEDGRREELNGLERMMAYGFEVDRGPAGLRLVLKADRSRAVEVREHAGCLRAFRVIGGREALLDLVYVEVGHGGLFPSVRSVDVFGTDPETGEPLRERVVGPQ